MYLKKIFFGISALWFFLSASFAFGEVSEKDVFHKSESHTAESSQFLQSDSPQVWLALSSEGPSYSTSQQEYAGGNLTAFFCQQLKVWVHQRSDFNKPSFYSLDQRELLLQFIYPFHFFF